MLSFGKCGKVFLIALKTGFERAIQIGNAIELLRYAKTQIVTPFDVFCCPRKGRTQISQKLDRHNSIHVQPNRKAIPRLVLINPNVFIAVGEVVPTHANAKGQIMHAH